MKRRNITPAQNAEKIVFNHEAVLATTVLREPSVVDEFYFDTIQPAFDDKEAVVVQDPIIMLFNQERLQNMGAVAAKTFLDSLVPKSDALAELRSKCSDDDLMCMVKSRHLQSPAEILWWAREMQSNMDTFNSELQQMVEAQKTAEQPSTEPLTTE